MMLIPLDKNSILWLLCPQRQYLGVLAATHDSTQGRYNGWVFESLFQLGSGLKMGNKRGQTENGCHK